VRTCTFFSRFPSLIRRISTIEHLAGDENSDQYELWVFDCEKRLDEDKTEKWTDQQLGGKAMDGASIRFPTSTGSISSGRQDLDQDRLLLCRSEHGEVRTVIEEELHRT